MLSYKVIALIVVVGAMTLSIAALADPQTSQRLTTTELQALEMGQEPAGDDTGEGGTYNKWKCIHANHTVVCNECVVVVDVDENPIGSRKCSINDFQNNVYRCKRTGSAGDNCTYTWIGSYCGTNTEYTNTNCSGTGTTLGPCKKHECY